MNTQPASSKTLSRIKRAGTAIGWATGGLLLTSLPSTCGSASVQPQPQLTQVTPSGQSAPTGASQFLGSDATLLQPGGEGKAAYDYLNSNVQWSNYKKVLLKPVEFWDTEDSSASPDDQKMLTSYF
jgi:hypothetical protein